MSKDDAFQELLVKQKILMDAVPHGHKISPIQAPKVVACLGIIEEAMEYLNAVGFKSWRPNPLPKENQLEELTDMLFFYLESVLLSDFSWEQVIEQYHKKWSVNMERYRRALANDYGWDDRGKKDGL